MNERIFYRQTGKDPLYKTWHASEENLFIYFHSDGGSIVTGNNIFPIKKGALVFIAAGVYHYTMPDNAEKYDRSKLNVSSKEWSQIIGLTGNENLVKCFSDKAIIYSEIDEKVQSEIESVFKNVFEYRKDASELLVFSACFKLLYFLNRYSKQSTEMAPGNMSKAIDYINKNIAFDIKIDDICAAVNMSKHYFCREFKKHTGMTVMKYVLKTRIILAKNELNKSSLSITEISEKFGFSGVSYFCRVFKESEKLSPLKYRKERFL